MAPIHKSVRSRSLSENDVTSKAESVDHSDHTDESSSNQLGVSAELTPKSRIRRMSERHLSHQSTQEDNDNRVEQNENDCPIEDEPIQTTQDDKEENEVFDDHGRHSEKDEEGPKNFVQKRTRGRPRKSFVTTTEEPMPTRKSSRQMLRNTRVAVEDESRIRRRDKIKSVDRYSPEPIEVKRPRKSHPIPLIDPVHSDSDSENTVSKTLHPTLLPTKKMLLKRSANESLDCDDDADPSSNVFIVDVKKDMADGKVLLTLTDGASYCIETKNSHQSFDDSDFGADEDDSKDKDYKDTSSLRRKSGKGKLLPHEGDVVNSVYNIKTVAIQATGIKMPKKIRKANRHQQQMQTNTLSPVPSDETFTTKITTPGGPAGKGTVTYITTPKSVSLTPASTYSRITSSKRNYQNTQAKFLNEGPDLSECSSEDINSQFELLADRVLLVSSDLPLEHSITSSGEQNQPTSRDRKALFSQVISPITTDLICLLCPKVSFRDESLLIDHYEHTHELKVDRKAAKFSEDIVYVCLPENVIMKLRDPQESTSVMLNASCQYCGDDVCLDTLENMESHYEKVHRKSIQLVEQEKILDMHRHLRCCVCDNESNDFASHHRHMKEVHRMHTLVCRACTFTTSDPNRLSTHFRAKHLIGLRSQNMQCHFCNGICIGIERMNKHLQSAHCVQTGPNEFSCTVCLQPHGSGEQLLQHSWNCPGKAGRDELLHSHHLRPHHFAHHTLHHPTLPPQSLAGTPTFEAVDSVSNTTICTSTSISKSSHPECFLCGRKFDTSDKLDLHLHHVHARWGNRIVLNDTFLMVQHKDGKTDLMPSQEHTDSIGLDNLPNNRLLEEIGAKTQFGYYCHKCECVIRIYQLFYLHMYNLHKQWKQFECRISTCKQVFYSANDFRKHVQDTQHPQYSVIERPLDSIACHICDSYFLNEQQMEKHNLSDEHHARLNKSIEKTLVKTTEARNFKCKTCHTWFGLMDSFVYHMENESHKHGCPHCGLHFALPSSRRTHIQSVHADR